LEVQFDDLSWSKQVSSVVSKARRILGKIYHTFYHFCGTSITVPFFVWDPPLVKDQEALES